MAVAFDLTFTPDVGNPVTRNVTVNSVADLRAIMRALRNTSTVTVTATRTADVAVVNTPNPGAVQSIIRVHPSAS